MGSPVSELMTVPRMVYFSSIEFCGDPNDAVFWISSEAELRAGSWGGSKDGAANRLVARSVKRGVPGSISSAIAVSKDSTIVYNGSDAPRCRGFACLKAIHLAFADRGA